jgi:pimeloyl-ACP methyl ester carboxylesterase
MFYNDCPKAMQDWALDRLNPQCRKPLIEVTPLRTWPSVPVSIINAIDDRCIPPGAARANSRRLFGVDPKFVPGGHLPFLSQPDAVADLLVGLGESTASTQAQSAAR